MNRTELISLTVKDLREIAKVHNITGRWSMTKNELVDAILAAKEGSKASEKKTTQEYLSNIAVGTLVAFKRSKNKDVAMSGKFVEFKDGKVLVESKRGTVFKVSPESIIWVKTGARWPKWVYSLFNKSESEVENGNAVS